MCFFLLLCCFLSVLPHYTVFPSAVMHHSSVLPLFHEFILSISLIEKQIFELSPVNWAAHFHLRALMGALSPSPPSHSLFSLTHIFHSSLCAQLLYILIYINLSPFQPHWVGVHYCHPPQQSAPPNRGRHRWRAGRDGKGRVVLRVV